LPRPKGLRAERGGQGSGGACGGGAALRQLLSAIRKPSKKGVRTPARCCGATGKCRACVHGVAMSRKVARLLLRQAAARVSGGVFARGARLKKEGRMARPGKKRSGYEKTQGSAV